MAGYSLPSLPGFSGSSGSSSSSFPSHKRRLAKSSSPSATELLLALKATEEHQKHEGDSFLGHIVHGTGGALAHAINFIERPYHGLAQGTLEANAYKKSHHVKEGWGPGPLGMWESFGHGLVKGLEGHANDATFGKVLKKYGMPSVGVGPTYFRQHKIQAGLLGTAFDIGVDPLTYTTAFGTVTKGAAVLEKLVNAPKGLEELNKARGLLKELPDETHLARKALNRYDTRSYELAKNQALKDGVDFQKNDLEDIYAHLSDPITGQNERLAVRDFMQSVANHESKIKDIRNPVIKVAGVKAARVPLKLPTIAGQKNRLAQIFNPESNSLLHGIEITRKHYAESRWKQLIAHLTGQQEQALQRKLTAEEQKAVRIAAHGLVTEDEKRIANEAIAQLYGTEAKVFDKKLFTRLITEKHGIDKFMQEGGTIKGIHITDKYAIQKLLGEKVTPLELEQISKTALKSTTANPADERLYKIARQLHNSSVEDIRELAKVPNPAAKDMLPLNGSTFKDVMLPKPIKYAIPRMTEPFYNDRQLKDIMEGWSKIMRFWKISVTSVNPGYGIRNSLTDMWNAMLTGVSIPHQVEYAGKAAAKVHEYNSILKKLSAGGHVLTHEERKVLNQFNQMNDQGILSGLFAGDVQKASELFKEKEYREITKSGNVPKLYVKGMGDANRYRENLHRISHYLYRLNKGESPAEAARWVRFAHFDYEDLTKTEQYVFKNYMPFYTWARKNIPFQLKAMATSPGKFASFFKLAQESEQAAGGTKGEIIPDFLKESPTTFKVPFFGKSTYFNPALGVSDLAAVIDPKRDFIKRLGPQIQIPVALITGKNTFSGEDVSSGARRAIPDWMAPILKNIPGADVGPLNATVGDKEIRGQGANPWMHFFLGQEPMVQTLMKQNQIDTARRGIKAGALSGASLAWLSGQPFYNYNQQNQKRFGAFKLNTSVKDETRKLQSEGLIPKRKRKKSKLDDVLAKNVPIAFGRQ